MKVALSLVITLFIFLQPLKAQNDTTKTPSDWKLNWIGSLNGSQAEYSNWSQGGSSSLALTGSTVFDGTYKHKHFGYTVRLNLKYGQNRINGNSVQKTDDLIRLTNKVNFFLSDARFSAYSEVDFRTQFDRGNDKDGVYISNFFAPAFLQESAGMSFKPNELFTSQLGLSFKQTYIADKSLYSRYGIKQGENFRSEGGISMVLGLKTPFYENLSFASSFETFTNFLTAFNYTDFTFSNEVTGKINSFLSANVQFIVMYDRDFSKRMQMKQVLALGFNYKFL